MTQDRGSLPQGAGAQRSSSATQTGSVDRPPFDHGGSFHSDYSDEHESGYRTRGRAVVLARRPQNRPETATIVGAAVVGALAGAAIPFMFAGRSGGKYSQGRREDLVEEVVTINRPARELYDFWRDFTNLPQFMDNIKSVQKIDERRSHWVIKAPAGTSVEFDSRVTEDIPGRLIAWESEPGASVPNRGRVEFIDNGGRTTVRARISYEPPAGAAGKAIAKIFHREPETQAREDLARFKQVMEGRPVVG
jgi:uncharacterized membrane protein